MKRILRISFALLFMILIGTSGCASASEVYGKIKYENAIVRKSGSDESKIIGKLDKNDSVKIVERSGEWVKITNSKLTGWMRGSLIAKEVKRHVKIDTEDVNIRKGPWTGYDSLGKASKGETFEYIETYHSWYKINYKKQEAFVAGWLGEVVSDGTDTITVTGSRVNVRKAPNSDGTVIDVVVKGDKLKYLGEKEGWYKVSFKNQVAYIASWLADLDDDFGTIEGRELETKIVSASKLNLRSYPTTKANKIGYMERGERVSIVSENNDWAEIITEDGKMGYASVKYMKDGKTLKGKVVVVDAGHGGKDPGAKAASGKYEKNYALKYAFEVKKKLEEKGAKVYMTRSSDVFVNLYERAAISERKKADAFVSIHFNALNNDEYHGTSTYYDTSKNKKGHLSKILANKIYNRMVSVGAIEADGVKDKNYVVVREQDVPATLVEVGFISNKWEEENINFPSFVNRATKAIVDGVEEFLISVK